MAASLADAEERGDPPAALRASRPGPLPDYRRGDKIGQDTDVPLAVLRRNQATAKKFDVEFLAKLDRSGFTPFFP